MKKTEQIVVPKGYRVVMVAEEDANQPADVPTNAPKKESPVDTAVVKTDNRMSKGKGYLMLIAFMGGVVLVWASLANMYLFGAGAVCIYGAFWIYQSHLKKGGKTIAQALAENKAKKVQ